MIPTKDWERSFVLWNFRVRFRLRTSPYISSFRFQHYPKTDWWVTHTKKGFKRIRDDEFYDYASRLAKRYYRRMPKTDIFIP